MKRQHALILSSLALAMQGAWATNGMLMEGYGPESLALGGTSMAYDNGTAAMMNNPATLQLGANGSRLDVALGNLGPNVVAAGVKSGGSSYFMPALGWVRKNDQFSWGVGLFGQGGMGTEYPATSALAGGTGEPVRSELSVGRVIFPVAMKVNEKINVGGTLDYTWGSMDMRLAASTNQLLGMYAFGNNTDMAGAQAALGGLMGGINSYLTSSGAGFNLGMPTRARLDFSDTNDFTGAAKSSGWTGKLGMTVQASDTVRLGMAYQARTHLGDMKTSATGAAFTLDDGTHAVPIAGQLTIKNFQMPSSVAVGMAWQANSQLSLMMDVKSIDWSSVMSSFNMSFAPAMGGDALKFGMPQNWKDQTVTALGVAYRLDDSVILRAGYSHSTNPVPNNTVHPLFPAITANHVMLGAGMKVSKTGSIDLAISHAPKVTVTSDSAGVITHSQTNWQLMYTHRY